MSVTEAKYDSSKLGGQMSAGQNDLVSSDADPVGVANEDSGEEGEPEADSVPDGKSRFDSSIVSLLGLEQSS
jgi:hypothetical protein